MALKYSFKDMVATIFLSRQESLAFEDSLCGDLSLFFLQRLSQQVSSSPQGSSGHVIEVLPHQLSILRAEKMSSFSCLSKNRSKRPIDIAERKKQEVTFRHERNTVWITVIPNLSQLWS